MPDGRRTHILASGGAFGMFVFVDTLPDVDWVVGGGAGVTADLAVSIENETELLALVHDLSNLGWATANARWSIQQATTNWHGYGPQAFADAIVAWAERYEPLDTIHHSEEFCYFDVCDGGLYTLTGDVAASKSRRVMHANLSFQMTGIPLDTAPLQHLHDKFDVETPVYFRPMQERSIKRDRADDLPIVEPVALIVEPDRWPGASDQDDWVVGIVVKNPGYGKQAATMDDDLRWLEGTLTSSECLVCDLRSHHPVSQARSTYRLWHRE